MPGALLLIFLLHIKVGKFLQSVSLHSIKNSWCWNTFTVETSAFFQILCFQEQKMIDSECKAANTGSVFCKSSAAQKISFGSLTRRGRCCWLGLYCPSSVSYKLEPELCWNWNFLSTKTAISECSQVAFWNVRERMEFLKSMPTPLGGVRQLMAIWQSPSYGPASNSAHITGTTQVPASGGQASQRAWSLNWEHLKHSGQHLVWPGTSFCTCSK